METKNSLPVGLTFDDVLIQPGKSNIEPADASLKTLACRGVFLNLPFMSAAMDRVTEENMAITLGEMGALGVLHRNCTVKDQVAMVKKVKAKKVLACAACGPFDIDRAEALDVAGCDIVIVDCAHGHNSKVIAAAKKIKKKLKNAKLIVGNIATAEAARELVSFVDGIKVGIGPGSICTTRIVSGVGVPQLTAVMDVAKVANKHNIPVIADGGIRTSGDIAKALAAGASSVMLGNLLAGTKETPGNTITRNGKRFKEYRGMGSRAASKQGFSKDRYLVQKDKESVPEGVEAMVEYRGPVTDIVKNLAGGVQVSMGYVGAPDIKTMMKKAKFMFVTKASIRESQPHDLDMIIGN